MNWTAMANMKGKQCWTSMFKAKPSPSHNEGHQGPSYEGTSSAERSLPETKPRWKPKPEQLRILISKFDSGMMKPCPDEIKRIRAQLQEFGEVENANIVYWFQNRKFRSRQRQRNLQSVEENKTDHSKAIINVANATADSLYDNGEPYSSYVPAAPFSTDQEHFNVQMIEEMSNDQCSYMQATLFSTQQEDFNVQMNEEMSNDQCSYMQAVAAAGGGLFNEGTGENFMSYENSVRVLINNFALEVPVEPINIRTFFGENAVLLHSTGEPVLVNEWGFTLECLQQGAEYYLI